MLFPKNCSPWNWHPLVQPRNEVQTVKHHLDVVPFGDDAEKKPGWRVFNIRRCNFLLHQTVSCYLGSVIVPHRYHRRRQVVSQKDL